MTFLAVVIGVWQYRRNSERDFIKPVREAQLKLFQEASSAAAQLATLPRNSAEWKKSRDEFLRLFYGPLAIVEDRDVESAMIIFKSYIDNENRCQMAGGNAQNLSLALAHTCRQSLGESWGYSFEQLKGRYQELAANYWAEYEALSESHQPTKS